ncbi:MAG: Ig-like domain-containing protein [Tenuifilaceae bacterium]|nr:Ig-like domain-containing protein [Tenuifilaceae bacterium]
MKRLVYIIPFAFFVSLLFPRCAVQQSPTGGPKDTIPPVLVRSDPALNATSYKRDRITLTFDEYIKLEKIGEKLVLSPPQEQLPEFRIRGKGIEVRFFEPLDDSTTYTLYFADAIVDNNEGNKLENFEFAFATGHEIDSLRFNGRILDAYTQQPKEGVFVMLYTSFEDSIPLLKRPRYVTKTNKEGIFFLSNLKYGNYKIFALADGNSNYKFDQVSEEIAFVETPIDTSMLVRPSQVTLNPDSLLTLYLFQEENRILSLTDFKRSQRRHMQLGFTRPPVGDVLLRPLSATVDSLESWYIKGKNTKGDSLDFWITNNQINSIDTLRVLATYQKTDSLMNLIETKDTLRLFYIERATTPSRTRRTDASDKEKEEKKASLPISLSVNKGGVVIPTQKIRLSFKIPLQSKDTTLLKLKNMTDSVALPFVGLLRDTLNPRFYYIKQNWQNVINYQLTALPGAFTDLDGLTNDTLIHNFKGADPEQFGIIKVNLTGVKPNIIAELTTEKGVVVDSKTVYKDGEVTFTYVRPGKFRLQFIEDANKNGKWDTGWYLMGQQPERVHLFVDETGNGEIQVRANWDYDLSFNLKPKHDVSCNELHDVPNPQGDQHESLRVPHREGDPQ